MEKHTMTSIACLRLCTCNSYDFLSSSSLARWWSLSANWDFVSLATISADRCIRELSPLSFVTWLSWFVSSSMRISRRRVFEDGRGDVPYDFVSKSTMRTLSSLICFSSFAWTWLSRSWNHIETRLTFNWSNSELSTLILSNLTQLCT